MPYEVFIPDEIKQEIKKKIDRSLADRLDKLIDKVAMAPESYGKPLRAPLAGIWETYFDKRYRILYRIDVENKTIIIVGIRHKDEM